MSLKRIIAFTTVPLWLLGAGCSSRDSNKGADGQSGTASAGSLGDNAGGSSAVRGASGNPSAVSGSGNSGTGTGGDSSAGGSVGSGGGALGNVPVSRDASTFSIDQNWQFIRRDVTGADAVAFDDTAWSTVSTPHTYNDVDSYDVLADHSNGDTGTYQGPAWYRKHFKLPMTLSNNKVLIEFERIKQGAKFYINGTPVGVYDDGITACGIDLTGKVKFGAEDNVLAVRVDNSGTYVESTTGVAFEWQGRAFNPNYGGLPGHVWLHAPGKVYQTYPLYNNLKTSGVYVYGSDFANITGEQGDMNVNVESEIENDSGVDQMVTLSADIIDPTSGVTVSTVPGTATSAPTGHATIVKVKGAFKSVKLWSDVTPNLYTVVSKVSVGGQVVNTRTILTGFRKAEARGGIGTGGLYLNNRFVNLLGFAQRATNDWAALGAAVPDWMHDYHASLIRNGNNNYIRWMHVAPQKVDVASNDKYGIVNIVPAGDKEADVTGVQWTQRVNVMRATMIYLRNNPSVVFWEAGNNGISGAHMKEMQDLRKLWDPSGGRAIGCRDLDDPTAAPYAEYFGTMLGFIPGWTPANDASYSRGYTNNYRNQAPVLEAEDERDEAARRYWDDYSPPHVGGFKPGPNDTYHWTSESIITGDATTAWQAAIYRLNVWKNTYNISNTDSAHSRYSGYASIYFSDSDADGRQMSSEVCRTSGKVDAVRIPKELYYAHAVVAASQPSIHIIGHWTYPAGTKKTMYVVSNTPSVELFVNGKSIGKSATPTDRYLFSFPAVTWVAGSIKAVGYDASGAQVTQHELKTAGAPAALKLTPTVGPNGFLANGADVAMFDFEVVDASGARVPTDEAKVDFKMTGPGIWRGGYNSGVVGSTNKTSLMTEAGINRVFVRSTLTAGDITLTASRSGLASATATVTSKGVTVTDGLN